MKSLLRLSPWLTVVAVLFTASNADAQTRIVRTSVQPGVNVYRPVARPFATTGNPYWYQNQNTAAYTNPNAYINYSAVNSYLAATAYNPYAYRPYYYSGYNPYAYQAYNPYLYNPYVAPAYNPYPVPLYNPYASPLSYSGY